MATLWIFGKQAPRSIELTDNVVTIGRGEGSMIRVSDSTISKRHARLIRNDKGWWLEDLGSANGSWVDGQRVKKLCQLDAGVRFKLGKHEFSINESEVEEDSLRELRSRGTIFTSIQAIPSGVFNASPTMPIELNQLDVAKQDATNRSSASVGSVSAENDSPRVSRVIKKESSEERKLRLIRSVGEAVIDMTETVAVAEEILHILVDEVHADRAFVCLFAEDGSSGLPLASYGVQPGEKIVFSRTVCDEMLKNRSGVLITQAGDDGAASASLAQAQVNSTIYVPLWTKDRIMGFLSMDITHSHRSFTESDLELLISVTHQAAIGLERARLSELAMQERKRRDYLCQYLDDKLVHSVLNSSEDEDPLAPREQIVTVMFCDIVSFTKLSEGLSPGELAAFIQDHLTSMTEILFAHNGTVDKYIGDAVMALFGAPVSDAGAPEFAIQAAFAMRKHAALQPEPAVRLRFGIATGPAIVGNIGSAQRREYTALGDTVNVASRLESFARPNEVIIDEQTAHNLASKFRLHGMGEIDVRNRSEPVRIYQVEPH